ncbi:MAG: C40 family peptidase [Ignavibacterium sp.]
MKEIIMNKFIIVISILLMSYSQLFSQDKMNEIKNIIEAIGQKYSPDKRVSIYDIQFKLENDKVILFGETNISEVENELINAFKQKKYIVEYKVELLPCPKLKDKIYGIINISVANIRANPEHSAELVTQSLLGTIVNVYKKENGWFLVQTPDNYIGWLDEDGLFWTNKIIMNEWKKSEKIILTSIYGFSFIDKNKFFQTVSDLVAGNLLQFISDEKNFFKIKYPDGRLGYISKDDGKLFSDWINNLNPTSENIISTAKKFLGIPYLWGGTSTKAFDCSGFTKTVYFLNGIILPRDASQQVNIGEFVDTTINFEKLQPGDLLFFGRKENENNSEKIVHVGIYIGDTEFIHASGMVKINSLDKDRNNYDEYRFKSFVKSKRILNSINKNGVELIKENKFYFGD